VEIKWIPGKSPTLLCFDEEERTLFTQDIADLDEEGIAALIRTTGVTESTPAFVPELKPTEHCIAWRQSGGCDPFGIREAWGDKLCRHIIDKGRSGFCQCTKGKWVGKTCDHADFNCEDECIKKWKEDPGDSGQRWEQDTDYMEYYGGHPPNQQSAEKEEKEL
jgi:hypothetical protein